MDSTRVFVVNDLKWNWCSILNFFFTFFVYWVKRGDGFSLQTAFWNGFVLKYLKSLKVKCRVVNVWSDSVPPYLGFLSRQIAAHGSADWLKLTANYGADQIYETRTLLRKRRATFWLLGQFDCDISSSRFTRFLLLCSDGRPPSHFSSPLLSLSLSYSLLWKINASFDVVDTASTHLFTGNFVTYEKDPLASLYRNRENVKREWERERGGSRRKRICCVGRRVSFSFSGDSSSSSPSSSSRPLTCNS